MHHISPYSVTKFTNVSAICSRKLSTYVSDEIDGFCIRLYGTLYEQWSPHDLTIHLTQTLISITVYQH